MRISTAMKLKKGDRVRSPEDDGIVSRTDSYDVCIQWNHGNGPTRYRFGQHENMIKKWKKLPPSKPMTEEAKEKLKEHNRRNRKKPLKELTTNDLLVALDYVREQNGWEDRIPENCDQFSQQYFTRMPSWFSEELSKLVPCWTQKILQYKGPRFGTVPITVFLFSHTICCQLCEFLGIKSNHHRFVSEGASLTHPIRHTPEKVS